MAVSHRSRSRPSRHHAATIRLRATAGRSHHRPVKRAAPMSSTPRCSCRIPKPDAALQGARGRLPGVVVTELEGKRHHPSSATSPAALRFLDDLRIAHGRLDAPVPIGDEGGSLRVELNHTDPESCPPRRSAGSPRDKQVRLVRGDREAFGCTGAVPSSASRSTCCSTPTSASSRSGAGRHRQVGAGPVRRPRGRDGAPRRTARWSCSGRCTPSAARSSATCPAPSTRRWARGRRPSSTPSGRWSTGGGRRDPGPRHARGPAADAHPGSLPARRLRHRRRGAVVGAQCPAHRAVPDRPELQGRAHPRRRPARQPASGPARRGGRGHRDAQGAPAVRAHDLTRSERSPDRRPGHRPAGGPAGNISF
jgi:hypothetical protein